MKPTTRGLLMSAAVLLVQLDSRRRGGHHHQADAFTVHPASFNSYPASNDRAPDDAMRAESERLQTRLREQQQRLLTTETVTSLVVGEDGGAASSTNNIHHDVDKSKFERILVQLAAEYVQDTTELCKPTTPAESGSNGGEGAAAAMTMIPTTTQARSSDSPSLINERLPAFLKPIPSNSTTTEPKPTTSGAMAASSGDDERSNSPGGKRRRVSRFLSALNPFRGKSRAAPPSDGPPAASDAVVDIDECPSWA